MVSPPSLYAKLIMRAEPERGFPLWYPEPNNNLPTEYCEAGFRIGDVGVVAADGTFDVFFNICLPEDHLLHATYGVPEGFRQIRLANHDLASIQPADHRGRVIATQSVNQKRVAVSTTTEAPGSVAGQGSIGIEFSSLSNEGALLVLPEGADKHDLCNLLLFEREALRWGKSWYEFAMTKLGRTRIGSNSLYLITGCHKTSSWSLAAFHQSGGSCNFNAKFTAGKIINGNISAAYDWQMTSGAPYRIGPDPYDEVKNQTVFIRGFKIAIRENAFLSLLRGDVSILYEPPNIVPRKAQSSQRAKVWSGSKNENHQTRDATNSPFRASNLHLDTPQIVFSAEVNERHYEDEFSIDPDISLSQVLPTEKVYHPSDLLMECIMEINPALEAVAVHDHIWSDMYKMHPQERDLSKDEVIQQICHKYAIISCANGIAYVREHSLFSETVSSASSMDLDNPADNVYIPRLSTSPGIHCDLSEPEAHMSRVDPSFHQKSARNAPAPETLTTAALRCEENTTNSSSQVQEHIKRQTFRRLIDLGILRPNLKDAAMASLRFLTTIAENLLCEPDNPNYQQFELTSALTKCQLVDTKGPLAYVNALGFRLEVKDFQPHYVFNPRCMEDLRIGASMLKETMDEEAQTQEPMQRSKPTVLRSWPAVRSHTDGEAGPQGAPTNSTRRGVASINNATGSTGRLPSSWHPTPGAFSIFPSGVDRLAGEDGYAAWAIRMKRAFEYCGLTDLIEGSFVKPLPGGALVPVWQRMNSYARTYITQSITDNILENISDLYDAKKIWDRLEQEYSQVNSNAITRWFSQLRHPMRLDENVLDHVTNFQRTRDRLATARFIIPDSTAAGILLSTLLYEPNHPQSWDHFVKKFEMSNTTTLSNLVGEIRQENHRRSSTTSTTNYYPRFIESKITPLEHDVGASGKNRCGNCKREGHDWSECSLSHGGREAQKRCQHCKRDGHDWPQCFLPGGGREGVWQNKAMGNKR